ncbi:MAG: mycothiol synthase, partial [Actinomycetota bacterium]
KIAAPAAVDAALAQAVRGLLRRLLPLELRDDRLDGWPRPPAPERITQPSAAAWVDDRLVAFLSGPVVDGRAELDLLVDPDVADPVAAAEGLLAAVAEPLTTAGATSVQLWARPRAPWHDELADRLGASPSRALHQMRAPLPVATEPIDSRPYRAHDDLDALRRVNNRAFASHPDQGGQSEERLLATMAEPWFRAEGLRIHEDGGRVAGFCWTKIHPARTHPDEPGATSTPLGEIYVIGVDPDFHGRGKGGPMTAAGLTWLYDQGLTTGMLYVEANNEPAVRTYERLGFTIVRTDAAWLVPTGPR